MNLYYLNRINKDNYIYNIPLQVWQIILIDNNSYVLIKFMSYKIYYLIYY